MERTGFVFEKPWDDVPKLLMYIVTELSEAMEAWRDDDMEHFSEEIADTFIRLMHLVGLLKIPLMKCVKAKCERNRNRPYLHGRRRY